MKHLLAVSIVLSCLILTGCVDELNFEEPQPVESKNEDHFKSKFTGLYLCIEDSSLLTIDKKTIVREWHFEHYTTNAEIDSSDDLEIKEGKIYSKEISAFLSMETKGDTVILKGDILDTIFSIEEGQVLRIFKGQYFLNQQQADGFWTVSLLSLDKNILTTKHIQVGETDIEKIKDVTTVEEIVNDEGKVVDYSVKPTRKEIKRILRSDIFSESSVYRKIK